MGEHRAAVTAGSGRRLRRATASPWLSFSTPHTTLLCRARVVSSRAAERTSIDETP